MPPAPLDFPPTPTRHRKLLIASLTAAACSLFLAPLLMLYLPALLTWYSLVSLRHAALTHIITPDEPHLVVSPAGYSLPAVVDNTWLSAESRLFKSLNLTPGPSITLFPHQRLTSAGQPRLVALHLNLVSAPDGLHLIADLRLFTTGSLRSPRLTELPVHPNPRLPPAGAIPNFPGLLLSLGTIPQRSDFQLYPAQPDPQAPTKFSLPYTLNQTKGSFTFQLTNDDFVQVTIPPLFPPNPATHPAH